MCPPLHRNSDARPARRAPDRPLAPAWPPRILVAPLVARPIAQSISEAARRRAAARAPSVGQSAPMRSTIPQRTGREQASYDLAIIGSGGAAMAAALTATAAQAQAQGRE